MWRCGTAGAPADEPSKPSVTLKKPAVPSLLTNGICERMGTRAKRKEPCEASADGRRHLSAAKVRGPGR